MTTTLSTTDFYYDLPESSIAQTPLDQRDTSKLLAINRATGEMADRHFHDILEYLKPGDLLVMNDTKVLPRSDLRQTEGNRWKGGASSP
jgi:S-adenosylmethionine:tRNA ribosyltransferase-isomerase